MEERSAPSRTVLVVDDDHDFRELLALALGRAGFAVRTAADGREALARVAEQMPALILLDMRMPVMDGWEFARAYRGAFRERAPILVLTAATDARRWADEIGAEGYLAKPLRLRDLSEMVGRFVSPPG